MKRASKSLIKFPDPRTADEDGLLCIGGNLEVETLIEAYSHGIFPWPQEGLPLLWFSPLQRGVLDFESLHWPKRFLRDLRDASYQITFNQAFAEVIDECGKAPRAGQAGTWILPPMREAYIEFHEAGYAQSVECWKDGQLVGGLYGVLVEGVFSGESMFHKVTNASKRCLFALTEKLKSHGFSWRDIQMVTPVLETFGGKYISRDEFLERLQMEHLSPKEVRF